MSRESGFYWVHYKDRMRVGEFVKERNNWWLPAFPYPFDDNDFDWIDDKRIEEPEGV